MSDKSIDVVYTWVNGEDANYQSLCRRYGKKRSDLNPERYRDLYKMLKYSLRSLNLYVPWVRNIYLFTMRLQIPEWLNTDHPNIFIVHHDDVIKPQYLPTFSSNVIESYLHEIPNPSDYILSLDDDYLFGSETDLSCFINPKGLIKVYGTLFGENFKKLIYYSDPFILSTSVFEHIPILIYKPYWIEMLQSRKEEVHKTRCNKFREGSDLFMFRLYRYYLLANKKKHIEIVPAIKLFQYYHRHKITNNYAMQKILLNILKKRKPKFYCLNDDQKDSPNPSVVKLIQNFLDDYYPDKSPYEKI